MWFLTLKPATPNASLQLAAGLGYDQLEFTEHIVEVMKARPRQLVLCLVRPLRTRTV
jgi:hypothetical protein